MYTNNFKSQRGFILIIVAIVAVAIIAAVVLFVIETPRVGSGSGSCERLQERCEDSCGNDSNCKNDCFTAYQQCKKEEGR